MSVILAQVSFGLYVAEAGLEFLILRSLLPPCWDYRQAAHTQALLSCFESPWAVGGSLSVTYLESVAAGHLVATCNIAVRD